MIVFAIKTLGYAVTPFLFARLRHARAARKNGTARAAVVPARSIEWRADGVGPFRFRAYANYDEYLAHQARKYNIMLGKSGGHSNLVIVYYRLKFFERFRTVSRLLPRAATIVCAGARDGTEVEVWRDLGFAHAIGIDLNPGPENPLVQQGDFNHLPYADETVHLIYSNSIDHSYDFNTLFSEARRVLVRGGYALYEIAVAAEGDFEAVAWRRPEDVIVVLLNHFDNVIEVRRRKHWLCVLMQKGLCKLLALFGTELPTGAQSPKAP